MTMPAQMSGLKGDGAVLYDMVNQCRMRGDTTELSISPIVVALSGCQAATALDAPHTRRTTDHRRQHLLPHRSGRARASYFSARRHGEGSRPALGEGEQAATERFRG